MRTSAIVAVVALAAAAPAFAAPVASNAYARRDTTSTSTAAPTSSTAVSSIDPSEAISLGTVASIASFAAPVIGGIINHFKNNGNQQQRRDALELEALVARDTADGSEALSLGTIAKVGSFVAPVIGGIISHFTNNGNQQQRREALELQALLAREPGRLGDAATIAEFASTAVSAAHDFYEAHKGSKRDDVDASGALKLGDVANIASIGSSIVSAAENIFGGHSKREDATDESGAIKLGTVANIASIGSSLVSAVENIFNNRDVNVEDLLARDLNLEDLLARDDATDESGAIKLGTVANIASIGSSLVSAFENIFNGRDVEDLLARDLSFEELLARADVDESGALKLGDVANIASIGSSIVSAVHNIFSQRDLEELLARADVDESGALKLGDVANIASIGSSIVSAVHNIFSGNNGKREFMDELMARSMGSLNDLD